MASRCGAAVIDITPPPGFPLAGHGPSGHAARVAEGRLTARALVVEGARGERLALCVADLLSGSGLLLEQVAARTARLGLGPDRLVIAGTHTHHGPGGFFGNTLYDTLASSRPGARPEVIALLAGRLALAIERAADAMKPARIGYGESRLWGVARSADPEAFAANPESATWHHAGSPGHAPDPDLDDAHRAVDPRVRALVAVDARGARIATLALFAAHATALSAAHSAWDPDWPGVAAARAEAEFGGVVLVGAGPAGDANVIDASLPQGPALRDRVGERVARALVEAAAQGCENAAEVDVEARFTGVSVDSDLPAWAFGACALAGAEDGRSPLFQWGLVPSRRAGDHFPPEHPQHPKIPALGLAGDALRRALRLQAAATWPLHALRLGDAWIVTVPGEPTAVAGYRIERAVMEATGARRVLVLGCAGEYAGYFTTPEEYRLQAYEGASTLHGRDSVPHLVARLAALTADAETR